MKKTLIILYLITLTSCNKKDFELNFETEKEYVYSMSQTTHILNKSQEKNDTSKSNISGKGKLIIKSKANNLADISFENFTVKIKNDNTKDTLYKTQENSIIKNFKSDGTFLSENKQYNFGSLKILPLPTKKLSVGESNEIPHSLPLKIDDTIINSIGKLNLLFSGYENLNGIECAILKGEIDISELELPKNINGQYKLSEFGNGKYYFDLKEKCFVKAIVEYKTEKLVDNKETYENTLISNRFEINLLEIKDISKEKIEKLNTGVLTIPENTPKDIAMSVIKFLRKKDTLEYLNIAIPLEKQKKLFIDNIKFNPQENDTVAILKKLEEKYDDRTNNFLVRAGYILDIMKTDNEFEINEAVVDTIYYQLEKIKSYGSFGRTIIGDWAEITVEMTYNDNKYYLEIPQILNVEDKWYLYYPAYYFRDQKEKDFVERRVIELKARAEEFWK